MASPLLDQAAMVKAFAALDAQLRRRRVHADVYVVGGAAMTLAWNDRRTTRDIDALFKTDKHQAFVESVWAVAAELGLPKAWLNEQATAYMPKAVTRGGQTIWDGGHLRVFVADPKIVLAMKVRACRPSDAIDIEALMDRLDLDDVDQVVAIHDRVFGDDPLPRAKREALVDIAQQRKNR